MKVQKVLFLFFFSILFANAGYAKDTYPNSKSIYQEKPADPDAIYFTADNFKITADGKTDISDPLQEAINNVKTKNTYGIVFLPEGKYLISKTIYIPQGVRLIGYGKKRPQIILKKDAPGFQEPDPKDKGAAKYMFWFTNSIARPGQPISDANPSTFYSALSNIDLFISDGNPSAVALRAHFAQHSFIAHVDIHIGKGKAGLFDVGNEIQEVRFFGGEYGIYTTKPSPGWQFVMLDTYFEGQRKAAIKTREGGLTIVRLNAKNVPSVIDVDENYYEKLYMEDCRFEQISGPAIKIGLAGNAATQINLRNIDCKNVPVILNQKQDHAQTAGRSGQYKIKDLTYGLQIEGLNADPVFKTTLNLETLKAFPSAFSKDIPDFPEMKTWVNLQSLGAKGDGTTDDTKAIQEAIDKYPVIYVPQGWYRISETIKLKSNTKLIGLHPIGTQFVLADNSEKFGGFGAPKAMVETEKGGAVMLSGIGLYKGLYNNRAVGCKWMAGENSYMNDVKFVGGHGTMSKPAPPVEGGQNNNYRRRSAEEQRTLPGMDEAWNTQYWSLWVTDGGGGSFNNIWSANSDSNAGVYISNTSTPGRIYALSVEHHVLNEVVYENVSNWKTYALQLEEENRESSYAQPLDIQNCSNLLFANLYIYKVTRINLTYPYAIRTWNSKNIDILGFHNFSQTKYSNTAALFDVNSNTEIRPWEFAKLHISEPVKSGIAPKLATATTLAKGFEFANGMTQDSKGNIYFCEGRLRRIYKWSPETNSLSLLVNIPWEPLALAFDKNDQLLVLFKQFERNDFPLSPTSARGWGYVGFTPMIYSINPDNPLQEMKLLRKTTFDDIKTPFKAIYPANRGVGFYDYEQAKLNAPKEVFVAADEQTIIPVVADLFRANGLQDAIPGKAIHTTDEYNKRTVTFNVEANGMLSGLKGFAEVGEFSTATDRNGNVYIADSDIHVKDASGKTVKEIKVPERPVSLLLSRDHKTLYFTGRTSLYKIDL